MGLDDWFRKGNTEQGDRQGKKGGDRKVEQQNKRPIENQVRDTRNKIDSTYSGG